MSEPYNDFTEGISLAERIKRVDGASKRAAPAKVADPATRILDRVPPCSIETEECLLGCILVKPDVCDDIAAIVQPDDFFDEANALLFRHMRSMQESRKRIDISLLVERLKQHGDLDRIGGVPSLGRLASRVPHAGFAKDYAEAVLEYATRRKMIDACTESLVESYESEEAAGTLLERAESRIFSIAENHLQENIQPLSRVIENALDRLDARLKGEHTQNCVESGFLDLDKLTAGMHRSELTILAARPSMGKTALALNIAENIAVDMQIPVLFVSLEMSSLELIDRMVCSRAKVDNQRLRRNSLKAVDQKRFVDMALRIQEAPLFVDDSPSRTVTQIAAGARRLQRQLGRPLGLIVIDYLQLIEPDNPRDPRQEQVARIARKLKMLARDQHVPVLCLAQLNRQAEQTKDNRPKLSHLRESGAIEQDADVVMFIHREGYYLSGEERAQCESDATVIVAKQRNGPIGDVALHFRSEFTRFENAESRDLEPDYRPFGPEDPGDPFA